MADIKETAFGSFEQCNRRWENGDMICEMVVHWHNPPTPGKEELGLMG